MEPFRFKDYSNTRISAPWEESATTMPNNEYTSTINDLQVSVERMTADRDRWREIARMVAKVASSSPQTCYGRTVDHIIEHALNQIR